MDTSRGFGNHKKWKRFLLGRKPQSTVWISLLGESFQSSASRAEIVIEICTKEARAFLGEEKSLEPLFDVQRDFPGLDWAWGSPSRSTQRLDCSPNQSSWETKSTARCVLHPSSSHWWEILPGLDCPAAWPLGNLKLSSRSCACSNDLSGWGTQIIKIMKEKRHTDVSSAVVFLPLMVLNWHDLSSEFSLTWPLCRPKFCPAPENAGQRPEWVRLGCTHIGEKSTFITGEQGRNC